MKYKYLILLLLLPILVGAQNITVINSNTGVSIIQNASSGVTTIDNCPPSAESFISTWTTNLVGTSTDYQITLPLEPSGLYDFMVDWGDGNCDTITAYNQPEVTHTYAAIGTYQVEITGVINGWRFNNGGDKYKITDISQWGNLSVGDNNGYFLGCSNLDISAVDALNVSGNTTVAFMFYACPSITSINANWDTSNITNMYFMFRQCTSITNIDGMENWDTSKVTSLNRTFSTTTALDTDDYKKIQYWDVTSLVDADKMFDANTNSLSTLDYNDVLIAWEAQDVKDNVVIDFNNAVSSGAGTTAKEALVADHGWIITDGGEL